MSRRAPVTTILSGNNLGFLLQFFFFFSFFFLKIQATPPCTADSLDLLHCRLHNFRHQPLPLAHRNPTSPHSHMLPFFSFSFFFSFCYCFSNVTLFFFIFLSQFSLFIPLFCGNSLLPLLLTFFFSLSIPFGYSSLHFKSTNPSYSLRCVFFLNLKFCTSSFSFPSSVGFMVYNCHEFILPSFMEVEH